MIIGISGMISSGKSTLTQKLVDHYHDNCLYLNEYEHDDEIFNTFLRWLYERKNNIGLGFEAYVLENHISKSSEIIKKFNDLKMDPVKQFIFLDRYAIEHYIFGVVSFIDEKNKRLLNAYKEVFKELIIKEELPDFAIYLDMSFKTFTNRLFSRGREVETKNFDINKNYFEVLHSHYKDLFIEMSTKYNVPYKIINTDNLTQEQVFKKALEYIEKFKNKHAIANSEKGKSELKFVNPIS